MLPLPTSAPKRPRASSPTSERPRQQRGLNCLSASPRSARRSATRSTRATTPSAAANSSKWKSSSSAIPNESMKWYQYWRNVRIKWYTQLGIKSDRLRPREQGKEELAHYSIGTTDIEYLFPFSEEPQELEGVAHRGDLRPDAAHEAQRQGLDLLRRGRLEPTWTSSAVCRRQETEARSKVQATASCRTSSSRRPGADRFTLAVLCEAYAEDESRRRDCARSMRFHPRLAPIKAAVFPLVNKDGMPEVAQKLYRELKKRLQRLLRRQGSRRPPLSPPGRGGDAVLHHHRWANAAGQDRDLPRPRHGSAMARAGRMRSGRAAQPDWVI